jgi:hypothetical protein
MTRDTQYDHIEEVGLIYETGARHYRAFKNSSCYLYAASGGIMQMPHAGTIALWIRPTNDYNDGTGRWYFDLRKSGETDTALTLAKWSDNYFYAGWIKNSYEPRCKWAPTTLTKNVWHLIVCTWDDADGASGATAAYLDDSSVATGTCPWSDTTSGTWNFRIGDWCVNNDLNASADLSQLTIWDVELDATQRTSLYEGDDPLTIGDPILHYPIDGVTTESASVGTPSTLTNYTNNPPRYLENNVFLYGIETSTAQKTFAEKNASFFWSVNQVLYNGNGLFSDDDDSVLLLVDGVYQYKGGGQSDPEADVSIASIMSGTATLQPGITA